MEQQARGHLSPRAVEDARFAHLLPRVCRAANEYEVRQWSTSGMRAFQEARLQYTLRRALKAVPWYRDLQVSTTDLEKSLWDTFHSFPTLSKQSIREHLTDLVADDFDPVSSYRVRTSGSTGVPLTLLQDESNLVEEAASFVRLYRDVGINKGARVARINSDATRPPFAATVQLLPYMFELGVFNVARPTRDWIATFASDFDSWRPQAVFGNPSDIAVAAKASRRAKIRHAPRVAFTAGEILTQELRSTIESAWGATVRDIYSLQELRGVAWECSTGTLHVNDDRAIVESISTTGDESELVITTLTNSSMPLIRYRTADLGRYVSADNEPCSCGRALGKLVNFTGRDRGFIVLADGRHFGPKPIKDALTGVFGVHMWQLVQSVPGILEISLVNSGAQEDDVLVARTTAAVSASAPQNLEVRVTARSLEELVRNRNGPKFQMMQLNSRADWQTP